MINKLQQKHYSQTKCKLNWKIRFCQIQQEMQPSELTIYWLVVSSLINLLSLLKAYLPGYYKSLVELYM